MKYLLKNIEIWQYNFRDFPRLVENKELVKKYCSKKFSIVQFKKIEMEIEKELEKDGLVICGIMNPLYGFLGETVISVDLCEKIKKLQDKKYFVQSFEFVNQIEKLLSKHQSKLNKIFSMGKGDLSRNNNDGILFSNDKNLYEIERKISKIVDENKDTIVDIIKEFFVVNLKETVTNADSTNNPSLDAYINPYSL